MILSFSGFVAAALAFQSTFAATIITVKDTPDPCAVVASAQVSGLKATSVPLPGDRRYRIPLDAETAYQCVKSVPFNASHAQQFVDVAKQYSNFQTTLSYLKDPPAAYQQPGVDIMAEFDKIIDKVKGGKYSNQYDFDVDISILVSKTHEEHFNIDAGVLGLFTWHLNESIVSVSSDGKALPQIFASSDVENKVDNASPITTLDGKSIIKWLQEYAANYTQLGDIEPHADWNGLMSSAPFQFARGFGTYTLLPSYFSHTNIYHGPSVKGGFANGTTFEWKYIAGAGTNLGLGLISGQTIYDFWVLNKQTSIGSSSTRSASTSTVTGASDIKPRAASSRTASGSTQPSTRTSSARLTTSTAATLDKVPFKSYPSPDVIESGFGVEGGSVSGYIIKDGDVSIGVLSLPTFDSSTTYPSGTTASKAVAEFISKAQNAKVQKIVIDVQGNGGGEVTQGYDTFKRFFPDTKTTIQYRARAIDAQNVIGKLLTAITEDPDAESSWSQVALWAFNSNFTLKPDGSSWSKWSDFFGPREMHNDKFTNTMQPDFLSKRGGVTALSRNEYIAGYGSNKLNYSQPWKASDIIILSDGQCGSTCATFSELMKTDGGVKSVVVGGIPTYGPMQSVSGTRAGVVTEWEVVDSVSRAIRHLPSSTRSKYGITGDDLKALPPSLYDVQYDIRGGRFNGLDQIRASAGDDPLQFTYEAADCRLFYTGDMIRDVTVLWKAAAKVAGGDNGMCVQGSTNAVGAKVNETVTKSPGFSGQDIWDAANSTKTVQSNESGTKTGEPAESSKAAAAGLRVSGLAALVAAAALFV